MVRSEINREEMIGRTYGNREVLSIFSRGDKTRSAQVMTKCACGYVGRTSARYLLMGRRTDCGCHNKRNTLPTGVAEMNRRENLYKRGAEDRNLVWSLTREQFEHLLSSPCFYCSAPPITGIDRKEPTVGYVLSNCLPCCYVCNRMKSDLTYTAFITRVRAIAEHTK